MAVTIALCLCLFTGGCSSGLAYSLSVAVACVLTRAQGSFTHSLSRPRRQLNNCTHQVVTEQQQASHVSCAAAAWQQQQAVCRACLRRQKRHSSCHETHHICMCSPSLQPGTGWSTLAYSL
jgi:hypothetical protein